MSEQAQAQTPPAISKDMEPRTSLANFILRIFLNVVTAPYRRAFQLYTWQPLREIQAANGDRARLIPLMRDWKVDKYNEIQSVQIAATFCGGATLSTLPWTRTANAIWIVDALWFSSLICAISAIITSIQTKSILDDLPAREQLNSSLSEIEVLRMQRTVLRYKRTPGIKHWVMMFIWQFPSMTMAYAWVAFLCGLTVHLCTPFIHRMPWQDRHKIAIVYLAVGFVGLVTYVFSMIFVYVGEKDFKQSPANTRSSTFTSTVELEAGRPINTTSVPMETKGSQTVPSIGEINPVQITHSIGMFEFDKEHRIRRNAGGASGIKRQLLY
ncbi:hypothetical protein BKA66DRAFT_436143 [Pyrenochaeta sp. MPI-SDFR-AT-0127]|nr:hypothetical protein BKA66DRAFT_436143 [Pyrenochaeta sp. MPI-SDFR-AT-0127]